MCCYGMPVMLTFRLIVMQNNYSFGVPWKSLNVTLGVGGLVGVVIVVAVLAIWLNIQSWSPSSRLLFLSGIIGTAMFVIPLWFGPIRHKVSIRTLGLGRYPTSIFWAVGAPLILMSLILCFNAAYSLAVEFFGIELFALPIYPNGFGFEGYALLLGFVILALWGPLSEEVFFRAYVFSGLISNTNFKIAIVISSCLFALSHLTIGMVIPALFAGILLSWLYYKTRSIWPSFTVHALQNALAFLVVTFA